MTFLLVSAALLVFILCLPMTVQLDLHRYEKVRVRLHVQVLRFRHAWTFTVVRTARGHQLVPLGQEDRVREEALAPLSDEQAQAELLMRRIFGTKGIRRYLLQHVHLRQLDALVCLRLEDAARCALVSGGLQSLTAFLPPAWRGRVRVRVLPDFFRDRSTWQGRCILRFRLGMLIIIAGMLLKETFRQSIPKHKEAVYGTSHR